jgi:hypothetical protein
MDKTIKFRGKRKTSNELIYGYFVKTPKGDFRIYYKPFEDATQNTYFEIEPDSLAEFTGFTDADDKEIYDGDVIGDEVLVDGLWTRSELTVFWNQPTGSWHLDQSHDQDQTFSSELWLELNDFDYRLKNTTKNRQPKTLN